MKSPYLDSHPLKATAEVTEARHITWVGFWVNAFLGVAKIIGGIFGRSSALIADGIHSFSDFISDILVIVMIGLSRKRPDRSHQFGHGKFETLATVLLGLLLIIVAIGIFVEGLRDIIAVANGKMLPKPHPIALIILLISIVAKEWLYRATKKIGVRINSQAVIANAWHHRSDALSSLATLGGVFGAIVLGPNWHVLDPIAAMVVAVFIAVVGVKTSTPALNELLGRSLDEDMQNRIKMAILSANGVKSFHDLRTLRSGKDCIVEVHLMVDPNLTVTQANDISLDVERLIEKAVAPSHAFTNTHIEPYHPFRESAPNQ